MASTTLPASTRAAGLAPAMLPYAVAAAIYLVALAVGTNLLNDPDSYWHIVVGKWILTHGFPHTDPFSFTFAGKPWIAKEWLSQIAYYGAWTLGGWSGMVVLGAASLGLAFGLLTAFLQEKFAPLTTLVMVAVAFMLVTPHASARPHLLALPVMVAWVGLLLRAADRGKAPPYPLLLLMVLWANLHAGFTFGILMVAAIGLDAIVSAPAYERTRTAVVWVGFGLLTLLAACITPYGPGSLLVTGQVLSLGPALALIGEWKPADFSHVAALEVVIVLGGGFALYRGVKLPPVRIAILLGLLHMALSAERNAEILGLVAPLVLAAPLAAQFAEIRPPRWDRVLSPALPLALFVLLAAATAALVPIAGYQPNPRITPAGAVAALKQAGATRVFNDYDFGGYLIFSGVPTFIDGRTELYGEKFFVDHNAASGLMEPENLFRLLDQYKIEATLMRTQSAATKLLDHMDGWQKVYSDDIATIHVRKPGALHTLKPAVDPKTK
jgi:hypothetical protein